MEPSFSFVGAQKVGALVFPHTDVRDLNMKIVLYVFIRTFWTNTNDGDENECTQ